MDARDIATALAVGTAGAAVGAITGLGYPPVLAVASAVVATASCCTLLNTRDVAVEAGIASYVLLGLATVATGIPPSYGAPIGAGLIASAAIGGLALEVVSRAGSTIHAAKAEERTPDRWLRSARLLATTIDCWNGTREDRLLLAAGPVLAVGLHVATILAGAPAILQAATLVPVAVAGFAIFPFDATVEYVAPGTDGTVVSAHAPAGVSAAAIGSRAADLGTTVGSVLPDRDGSGGSDGRTTPAEPSDPPTDPDPAPAAGSTASAGGADAPSPSPAGAAADTAPDPCQNCGSEDDDREPRFVVSEEDLTLVLCAECHANRVQTSRSREDCQGAAVQGAIADASRCDACRARGSLEAHPIVPLDAGGHRHPNNVLALCSTCHAAVDDHAVAATRTDIE